MEVFGADWAKAWMVEINADPAYREAGRGWHGAILLRMWPDEEREGRSLYVDLDDGECRAARVASDADSAASQWVIGGAPEMWRSVLAGGLDPILGLLHGQLRLERGNLLKLVPYARAAKVLLTAAGRVPASFPGDANGGVAQAPPDSGAPAASVRDWTDGGAGDERAARSRRLDTSLLPMRLWQKAKKLGAWDPGDIDLKTDREDWSRLTEEERDLLLRLVVQFRGGEGAVTTELLPLMSVIADEGRVEEEIFLSSFLWEEAKHVEMFDRFMAEVAPSRTDFARFETAAWRGIFLDRLPAAMRALRSDSSPAAQVRAAVTYHLVVEGILAETGYHAYHLILERRGIMPGMQRAIQYIKRDESRHVVWGQYLIGRLVAEHGDLMWKLAESRLAELLEPSLDVIRDVFGAYDAMPFDLRLDTFTDFAVSAFRVRLSKLESIRHAKLHEFVHSAAD